MKLLFFCTFYHRALLFRQQMDALNERGHEVLAFNSAQYGEGVADKFKPIMDEKVVHCECWNSLDRLFFFPRQWKIEKRLQQAYQIQDFDLIHAHLLLSSGYSALRMKRKYGVPYVVSVRVTDLIGFIRLPYFRRMAIRILKNASGVLFLSEVHKDELLRRFVRPEDRTEIEKKCCVVGNCLESFWTEHRAAPRNSEPDISNELRILSVAKIKPIKNLTVAAQAAEILRKRGINASLTIVGEDQDHEELDKIKAFSCVQYYPFMTKEDLIHVYAAHDIFLLPSINETFGRVYLEAMSQGLPVLYTAGQGFDLTFPDGEVGFAVPSDDPNVIADKIMLILDRYKEISAACVNGSTLFDETFVMNALEKFYLDSLDRNPGELK